MSDFMDFYLKKIVFRTVDNDDTIQTLKQIKQKKVYQEFINVGDTVYLLDHPNNNDPNHLAVVRKIYKNNNILVSNTNMPFMGTYSLSNGLIKKGKYKKYNK